MDGRGDGAADGVTGGGAGRTWTLSLQQGKLILVHSLQRFSFDHLWASNVYSWDA